MRTEEGPHEGMAERELMVRLHGALIQLHVEKLNDTMLGELMHCVLDWYSDPLEC